MKQRGRSPRGDKRVWSTKVSDADIEEIKRLYTTGLYTQAYLAARFGVGQDMISRYINGKRRVSLSHTG